MQAVVRAERSAFRVHDFAGLVRQVVAQEIAHFYLADETDALAVFLACRGEAVFFRKNTHFRFQQIPKGKDGAGYLVRAHQGQEVGLVLVRVPPAQDESPLRRVHPAGVMAGGDVVEPLFQGIIQKDAEFHFPVAQYVRIGRISGAVAFNQIIHDAGAVFVHQVNDPEFNTCCLGDGQSVLNVLFPRAFAGNAFVIHPVFHVGPHYVMALLHEQGRCHGAVHSA